MEPKTEHSKVTAQYPRSKLAKVPGAVPLLGHSVRLIRDPVLFLEQARECGSLVEFRLARRRSYLLCSPDLVHQMLVTDVRSFEKGGPLFDTAKLFLGNALFTSHGEDHRRQRRIVQPSFHPDRIHSYAISMSEEAAAFTASWQAGQEIDVNCEMNRFTARVVARTVLSMDAAPETLRELCRLFEIIVTGLFVRLVVPAFIRRVPLRGNRRFNRALVQLKSLVDELIVEARLAHQSDAEEEGMLSALLNARDEETGQSLTDEEVRNQILNFLMAGTETSATILAWTLYVLASNPSIEARVSGEVDEVLGGRPARPDDLPRLSYTRDMVNEALRFYPPAWILSRNANSKVEFDGSEFPEGTHFYFSPYLLHHDPKLFPDPERFDPDRWNSEQIKTLPRGACIPFGMGKHKCIGDAFALSQVTPTTATVISRWRLRLAPGSSPRPRIRATIMPFPLRIIPEPRT